MSDIFDGIGTAATGSLFARALEPDSGAKKPHPDQPENCRNCGAVLTGAYCQSCGQPGHVHRTIGAFVHELLHGALHFEGKLWRTLPMLIFRPGQLTRRYIEGERARFVSPMALFLFGVFLMFAVFQMVGLTAPTDVPGQQTIEANLEQARETAQAEIATIEERLASQDLGEEERAQLEQELAAMKGFIEYARTAAPAVEPPAPSSAAESLAAGFRDGLGEADAADGEADATPTDQELEQTDIVRNEPAEQANLSELDEPETGIAVLDSQITKWRENPGLMLYKLQSNAYKFSWLLIPISIPFVWLLFAWKGRFKGYDHAIFVTYSLSFMTLLFITASLLSKAGAHEALIVLPLLFIPPIHIYKQLRRAYGIGRFSAFWRLLALSVFIWVVIIVFLQLLLMLGAF